jgi:hypothetical protein
MLTMASGPQPWRRIGEVDIAHAVGLVSSYQDFYIVRGRHGDHEEDRATLEMPGPPDIQANEHMVFLILLKADC